MRAINFDAMMTYCAHCSDYVQLLDDSEFNQSSSDSDVDLQEAIEASLQGLGFTWN